MLKIPKNIFFIWLGNNIPSYALYAVQAFKQANNNFHIQLVHKTINEIENVNVSDIIDQCLLDSINIIFNKYKIPKQYKEYVNNQKKIYGNDIRFIQLLSDIFRVQLTNSIGGIYLDCDTVPNKPFDDILLSNDFCVTRHYNNNYISQDNYFFGITKKNNINDFLIPIPYENRINQKYKLICQTIPNIQNNIKFIYQKSLFFRSKLLYKTYLFNTEFYINHYYNKNWKFNVCKIPICKYDCSKYKNIWLK